ncbi:hypothetical protein [Fulvivirga sp.]|uniref:hypothetical protein n=1 Tax=Fulvivirga sp. TaxID=1931237 RepID=UPI0032EAF34B
MKRVYQILLITMAAISCTNNEKAAIKENETPDVLAEDKSDINYSSLKRGKYSSIVEQLYSEALEKNKELNEINEDISKISSIQNDKMEEYRKYNGINQEYWNSINIYIASINDSTTQNELKTIITDFKIKYKSRIAPLSILDTQITKRELLLRDQQTLMKIFVTLPMILNYQENELPEIAPLNKVKTLYDTLIERAEPYTKLEK